MKAALMDHLVCIACKGPLECTVSQKDERFSWPEIVEGQLTCVECGTAYAVHRGVPRMIKNQVSNEVRSTVEGFGFEWQTFDRRIKGTYMTGKIHFLDFIHPVTEDFFVGKLVLDAGCGMGRFLRLAAEFGCREIIGVDLSESVETAYQNTKDFPNAHVVQADIMALPFRAEFDYIFSIGVLHHMQDPKGGFSQLANLLKKSGRISAWVYSEENNEWVIRYLSPIRKHLTSRLPRPVLYFLSHGLGFLLYALIKLVYVPANENRLGIKLGRLLPYNDYLFYSGRLSYPSIVSVIFDHLVPQLASYIPREEFEDWFRVAKLNAVTISSRNNMSWRGIGTRV